MRVYTIGGRVEIGSDIGTPGLSGGISPGGDAELDAIRCWFSTRQGRYRFGIEYLQGPLLKTGRPGYNAPRRYARVLLTVPDDALAQTFGESFPYRAALPIEVEAGFPDDPDPPLAADPEEPAPAARRGRPPAEERPAW